MRPSVLLLSLCICAVHGAIPNFSVSDAELKSLVNDLRSRDLNKARSGQIRLNFQGHASSSAFYDHAARKLFTTVDSSVFRRQTFEKFRALLNNYNRQTGKREYGSEHEKTEVDAFLDAVLATDVLNRLYNFLHIKRHPYASNTRVFKGRLKRLWFGEYSRAKGVTDTSGFEHVMVGEVKRGEVSGLHNWYQFYLLEKAGKLDYKGYLVKRNNVMAAVRYTWEAEGKRSGSFLIGSSPEFDLALYTLCFLSRQGRRQCEVEIDHCPMRIKSHVITQNGRDFIGSIYPTAGRMTAACRTAGRPNHI